MFSNHDIITTSVNTFYVLTDDTFDAGLETMVFPQKRNSKMPDYSNPLQNHTRRYATESEAVIGHNEILKLIEKE